MAAYSLCKAISSHKVQFIFLQNNKICSNETSIRTELGLFDIVVLENDRYFGSCEENLYRIQSIAGLISDFVLVVGDHDDIDWKILFDAVEKMEVEGIEALAINVSSAQINEAGQYIALDGLRPLNEESICNTFVSALWQGQSFPARFGFGALIAKFGPIDWAAYVGSHIYRRSIFIRILQYHFSEHVYSFVYKQALFFNDNDIKYSLLDRSVVTRKSDDFYRIRRGDYKPGWLEQHRIVRGDSKIFHIANLQYLSDMRCDFIYFNTLFSLTLSHTPCEEKTLKYLRGSMLLNCLGWSMATIGETMAQSGISVDGKAVGYPIRDLKIVSNFWSDFIERITVSSKYKKIFSHAFLYDIRDSVSLLYAQLMLSDPNKLILDAAERKIGGAIEKLPAEVLFQLHNTSFSELCRTAPSHGRVAADC